jgi:hypothetical protein
MDELDELAKALNIEGSVNDRRELAILFVNAIINDNAFEGFFASDVITGIDHLRPTFAIAWHGLSVEELINRKWLSIIKS